MRRFIKFLPIFLLFYCFLANEAKAGEALAWEDCVREAKKNHPDLISAQEKLNQAKADKAITAANILPQLSSDISQKTSKAAGSDKTDAYSYDITGKQLLFDGFKTSYDIRAALENIKSTQHNYETASSDVRLRLKTAFVELLKAQELLNITEDIAKRRRRNVELLQLRYEAGREHKGSLLTAQANSAQAEFEVAQARRNIDLAQRRLTKELGREKFTPIRVKGGFDIGYSSREKPDFENLAETNPVLQELIARKEAARFGLKSAKADFFPQVYANAGAGRTASDWPPRRDEWSAGVSVSLPIFEGGSRIAEVSGAKAAFNQTQADERSGRDSVLLALEQAWTSLQDAIDKVGVQRKFLEATDERAKITQAQYSTGLISFDNWTIIEDDLVRVKKSFLEAEADSLIAEANWIQAKGGTLDE
ncbi:MAG: TolC family protein [Candidatus Omnitrophota bacterium]